MDKKELKRMIKWANKNQIPLDITFEGVRYQVTPAPIKSEIKSTKNDLETDPELLKNDPSAGMPADSDLLFWSTDAYDIITETRKEDEPRN